MEVPALMTLLLGVATISLFFILRIPVFILGFIALVLLGVTVYYHINQFSIEYRTMTLGEGLKSMAPTILVGAVIVMGIGYILMMSPGNPMRSAAYGRPGYGVAPTKPGFFSSLFGSRPSGTQAYRAAPAKPGFFSSLFGSRPSGTQAYGAAPTKPGFFSSLFGSKPYGAPSYGAPGYDGSDRRAYVSALDRLI